MGWKKSLKRGVKAVATGGLSEVGNTWDSVSGANKIDRANKKALKTLSGRIGQGQQLSTDTLASQQGVLDSTYDDQLAQMQGGLAGANSADQQALAQYMQAQGANLDQVTGMLQPQADLQGQFMGSVADASTLDGMGNMLNQVRESDTYNSLLGERMDAAQNQFADAGLRRSTAAGEGAADIAQGTLMDLGNQAYGRQLNMLNMGNQGVNNLANVTNSLNTGMNNINMGQQNMMNQRAYANSGDISDLMGQRGANNINLQGQNSANQMNLLGQLGQAESASIMARGQNAANSRMAGLNLIGQLGGAYLTGGASFAPSTTDAVGGVNAGMSNNGFLDGML